MFKIKVDGKEFKGIIEKALCNLNKKAALPILTKVVLINDGNVLTTYTSNLESYLQVKTQNYVNLESGLIGIDEEDLKLLLKMTGEIIITEQENGILVQNGRKNISLVKYDMTNFPHMLEDKFEDVLQFSENDFAETINNLVTFTIENENNKTLACIHFNLIDNRIEALDGFRIGIRTIKDDEKIKTTDNILVMNRIVADLKKSLDKKSTNKVVLSHSNKFIKVTGNNFVYIQRKADGKFFNINHFFTNDFKLSFKVDTKEMLNHMKYYTDNVISKTDRKPIVLKISDNTITTYAKNARFEISDSMKIKEHTGEDLFIAFNPYFFVDALKIADSDVISIEGTNSKAPFFINANKYSFIILPVNINGEIEAMKSYLSKLVA